MSALNPQEFKVMQDSISELVQKDRAGHKSTVNLEKVESGVSRTLMEQGLPAHQETIKTVVKRQGKKQTQNPSKEPPTKARLRKILWNWVAIPMGIVVMVTAAIAVVNHEVAVGEQRQKEGVINAILTIPNEVVSRSHGGDFKQLNRWDLGFVYSGDKPWADSLWLTIEDNVRIVPTEDQNTFSVELNNIPLKQCEFLLPELRNSLNGLKLNGKNVDDKNQVSCQGMNDFEYPSGVDRKNIEGV